MREDTAQPPATHERMVTPLRMAARGSCFVVRDSRQRAVTWLKCNRFDKAELSEISDALVTSVNQHASGEEYKKLLAESIGRENCWDAILEAVNDLADDRERMQSTIGALRSRISTLEKVVSVYEA